MVNSMLAPSTFSIVACDRRTGEFGVAVQSRFFAIGAAVPHARVDAGAVATQGWFEPAHGQRALDLLESGESASLVLNALLQDDHRMGIRQFGIVDRDGRVVAYTGPNWADWAGHIVGDGFCCLGNSLVGPQVLDAMAERFRSEAIPLPERMLMALEAGQMAGGDRRGQQSAALLVARANSGFAWLGDRYIDIRVDDHTEPIAESSRLLRTFRAGVWGRLMEPVVVLDAELVQFVQLSLRRKGRLSGETAGSWDAPTREAVRAFCAQFGVELHLPLDGVGLPREVVQHLLHENVW
jgi:uncharacterized Ntn-hydrolase superfamily protein